MTQPLVAPTIRGLRNIDRGAIWLVVAGLALGLAMGSSRAAGGPPPGGRAPERLDVTPVSGPSWLHRLGLTFDDSCMGLMGRSVPPPVAYLPPVWSQGPDPPIEEEVVVLSGADLYRYNCQSCHKADGAGVPPGINSMIGPVQAMSPAAFRAQMRERGFVMDEATIRDLSAQSEVALRERIRNGGERMPALPHLEGAEVNALLAYLRLLASVPGAEKQAIRITEPVLRLGEHVVKGTCQICHDAAGPGRDDPLEISMMRGVVPSLASLPLQRTKDEVIRKVRVGLSEPSAFMMRGRMPVLDFLTAEEVGAVYEYLRLYPPRP